MYASLSKIAPLSILLLSASVLIGQTTATGTYPYGTFDSKGIDTINVGNLNVHLAIPVLQKTGRGMPFSYTLAYDSLVWQPVTVSGSQYWQPVVNWGWLGQVAVPTGYISYYTHSYTCDWEPPKRGSYWIYDTWVYHDPQGASHSFNGYIEYDPTGCDNTVSGFTATTTDGSGLTLNATTSGGRPVNPQTITTRSGQTILAPVGPNAVGSTITDTNGNQISVSAAGVFTDTTGVNVLTVVGQAPNPVTLTYPTLTGNAAYTMRYGNYTVQTAFGCSGVGEYPATSVSLINEIDLPDSSKYTFTYETTPGNPNAVTGRIASVTLPGGGQISYAYTGGSNGIVCTDGSTAGLTRSLNSDSGSAASTWTYVRIPGSGTTHTVVTDGLGNQSTYDFVLASDSNYYETTRSVYNGTATGTAVVARNTCYNGSASPCITTAISMPISQIDTYETLDGIQTHGATAKYSAYGMQTESDVYDFGAAPSRGLLMRKEVWAFGYSIPNLPTSDLVYDGSGNLAGETYYTYDGATPTPSSGVPQHASVSGPRGNLTSMTQYASSGTSYTTSYTYEDTGTLLSSTTPNGTTMLTYDSTFTYNTGATLPTPSSGITLTASETFDTINHTGLPLTSTDANSQVTSIPSYDVLLRPTEVDSPDGGKTTYSYSQTQVGQHTYQTTSVYSDTETQYDEYERLSRVEVANGQSGNGYYQTDTCYDANGNAYFKSYPYQGTGFGASKVCSGAGDTRTYDALGRVTSVTRANNESRHITYRGRAKQYVDENNVTRISQVDGLGRTTIVCEISAGNNLLPVGTTPVSCSTDIAGTGFLTTYSYTTSSDGLARSITTITQGAQTRTFQTDWLGRTTSVQEPESGMTTYGYAYNTIGLVMTRQRPMANQTNPAVLTTTTTQYDSLGRVVSISYSDGTPTKIFVYDQGPPNVKGRLYYAYVSSEGTNTSFLYDPMGRIVNIREWLPPNYGGDYGQNYSYDLAGDLATSSDGAGVVSTYTYSPAGELLSLTSSVSDATDPANLVSNVQNGPFGPVSYSLGNGLTWVNTYDALGRLSGGAVYSGGTQVYGYANGWKGNQLTGSADSVLNQGSTYGYDEFNRLTSRTVNSGTGPNYGWVYDRYGNRLQQNITGGTGSGSTFTASVNPASNQLVGYSYDAAGNMTSDGFHTYTFDAEGNITAVDSGATAQYVYNALNQRVQATVGGAITEYVYNAQGQRVSEWNGATYARLQGKYCWGARPVAYYANGATHFEHQDWLGTERLRTAYNGGVEGSYISLPFGDGYAFSGADTDANHYGMLDSDPESGTDHAQFRQYSSAQGRWLAPDPYSGSYSMSNPQSFNRYVYAGNNPLAATDPSGMLIVYTGSQGLAGWGANPNLLMMGLGGAGGVDCRIEGMDVPCGIAYGATKSGAAVQCPNNDCTNVVYNSSGLYRLTHVPTGTIYMECDGPYANPNCYVTGWKKTYYDNSISYEPLIIGNFQTLTTYGGSVGAAPNSVQQITGLATAWDKIEVLIGSAALPGAFVSAGNVMVLGGALSVSAGCLDPTPYEPATCAAGAVGAGLSWGYAGASYYGAYWSFKNVTVPVWKQVLGGQK